MAVKLERDGNLGVIVLDRPPANAYDYDFLREFGAAVDDARVDDDIRAVVVRSASDKFFSAGADLKAFEAASMRRRSMTVLLGHEVFRKMESTPLVFIAAINGNAYGGGLELALACDLRFACEGEYRMGLSEVAVGLFPGNGGTQRLPRLLGLPKGLEMIVNATTVTPKEAAEIGLVNRLFPDAASLRQGAMDYAARLAAGPTEAIGHAKVAAVLGFGAPMEAGLAIEREAIARVFGSEDAAEGIKAFTEKRKPTYRGR
jgi:enoyl-CoA hydratase/carnithine racemase